MTTQFLFCLLMCLFCWVGTKAVPNTTETDAFPFPHLSLHSVDKMVIQALPVDHASYYGPESWQGEKTRHCKPIISPGEECKPCGCREPPGETLAKHASTWDMGLLREGVMLRTLMPSIVFSRKNGILSIMLSQNTGSGEGNPGPHSLRELTFRIPLGEIRAEPCQRIT